MAEKAENNYEQLKMLQKKVPSKPMTEEEWRDICDFMGGCTLCGNPHIEVRSFLVPAVEGGAYSKYNMFPLCCDCDVTGRQHANPFKYFNDRTRLKKPQRERFKKLVDYLINLIEEDLADEKKN